MSQEYRFSLNAEKELSDYINPAIGQKHMIIASEILLLFRISCIFKSKIFI
jgi:hypothetical protein